MVTGMLALGHHRPTPLTPTEESLYMLDSLRAGHAVTDRAVDRLYPEEIRRLSSRFWTPVKVAQVAAQLCAPTPETRVLDMGAGVGRFCLIGAVVTGAEFVGVEFRRALVDIGREVLETAGVTRAKLLYGTIDDVDFAQFDAIYFFNPFEENLIERRWQMDHSVDLSKKRFADDVSRVEASLERARTGTRVVTYQGFGGTMPAAYELLEDDAAGVKFLRLWVKREKAPAGEVGTLDRSPAM